MGARRPCGAQSRTAASGVSDLTKGRKARQSDALTPKERAFVHAYTSPDSPSFSNGLASARVAGYKGKDEGVRVTASRILDRPAVVAAIEKIRAKAEAKTVKALVPWIELVPDAQQTLRDAMDGTIEPAKAKPRITAADKILDRALGKPTTKIQLGGDAGGATPSSITVRFISPSKE